MKWMEKLQSVSCVLKSERSRPVEVVDTVAGSALVEAGVLLKAVVVRNVVVELSAKAFVLASLCMGLDEVGNSNCIEIADNAKSCRSQH